MKNILIRNTAFCMLFALSLLAACTDMLEPPVTPHNTEPLKTAAVKVFVAGTDARTVFPDVDLADIRAYQLTGGKDGEAETPLAEFTETGATVELEPGQWNFTLNGLNGADAVILAGKAEEQTLTAGETTELEFELAPLMDQGAGNIRIIITFPNSVGITRIETGGDLTAESFSSFSGSTTRTFTYNKTGVESGYYFASFTLYKNAEIAAVVSEMVQVGNALTSAKTITLAGGDTKPLMPVLSSNTWASGTLSAGGERWYTFRASGSTQFIHAELGTNLAALTVLSVCLYDSEMNPLRETVLTPNDAYFTQAVTSGRAYYLRIAPNTSTGGTYRIAFNASIMAPGMTATALSSNVWKDGTIPATGNRYHWFTFNVTSSTSYFIHGWVARTQMIFELYSSNGNRVEPGSAANAILNTISTFSFHSALSSGTYYVRVTPLDPSYYGAYKIGFNTSVVPPGTTATQLSEDQWSTGYINEPLTGIRERWYTFTASAAQQYLHAAFNTLTGTISAQLYDSAGNTLGSAYDFTSSTLYTILNNLAPGSKYYIQVRPSNYSLSANGSYYIGFGTSTAPLGLIPLTANWGSENTMPATGVRVQWYTFTAAAARQLIHADFGTLTGLSIQLYNSDREQTGSAANLNGTSRFMICDVTPGEVYYVKVEPSGSSSGTYRMGLNTSPVPPGITAAALIQDAWTNAVMPRASRDTKVAEQWFRFTAGAAKQFIHYACKLLPTGGGIGIFYAQVYKPDGNTLGTNAEFTRFVSVDLTPGETYYVKVSCASTPGGAYRVGLNASGLAPGVAAASPLSANSWTTATMPNYEYPEYSNTNVQWQYYSFTSSAAKQYIHIAFGTLVEHANFNTLTEIDVTLYDSNWEYAGGLSNLTIADTFSSLDVTPNQTYYLRVSGDISLRIGGTYKIGFSDSLLPPGATAIELTHGVWRGGIMPEEYEEEWIREQYFTFTATAAKHYTHMEFVRSPSFPAIQLFDTNGNRLNAETYYAGGATPDWDSFDVTPGQSYYIKLTSFVPWYSEVWSNGRCVGPYHLAFNSSRIPPLPTIPLTENTWTSGTMPAEGAGIRQRWYTFTATAATHFIHKDSDTGTHDEVFYTLFVQDSDYRVAYNDAGGYITNPGTTYYLRVEPKYLFEGGGTYEIAFNTSTTPPP